MRTLVIGVVAAALGGSLALAAVEQEGYTYTLLVSSREPTLETIDVNVFVDRAPAAREQLRFGDVEDVLTVELALEPGSHRIVVEAVKGMERLEQELVVAEAGSAEVEIWFEPLSRAGPPPHVVEPLDYVPPPDIVAPAP
jgi:hypothetical protein